MIRWSSYCIGESKERGVSQFLGAISVCNFDCYTDANNGYRFKLFQDSGKCMRIHLHSFVNGEATLLDSQPGRRAERALRGSSCAVRGWRFGGGFTGWKTGATHSSTDCGRLT